MHCYICTKLYSTRAVVRKFLATGSAEMRDMGMDWSAASSDRGLFITNLPSFWSLPSASTEFKMYKLSLSKICGNSEQNWNLKHFHFLKYASTESKTEKLSLHQICVNSEHNQKTFTFFTVNNRKNFHFFKQRKGERERAVLIDHWQFPVWQEAMGRDWLIRGY